MERIMNEENDWDHNVEADAEEGPVDCVCRDHLVCALNEMNTGKAPGPVEVLLELFTASRGVGMQVVPENVNSIGSKYSGFDFGV